MSRGLLLSLFVIGIAVLPFLDGAGNRVEPIAATPGPASAAPASNQQPARPVRKARGESGDVDHQVPAGAVLLVTLRTTIGSLRSAGGDQVDATLSEAVVREGIELIPAGSTLRGSVVDALRSSKRDLRGRVTIAFHVVEHAATGSRAAIRTRRIVIDAPVTEDQKPSDIEIAAGQPLRVVLTEPLLVRIPR